jgi:hypothetical protein
MKILVIKVMKDGKVGYLRSSSIFFSGGAITDNPLEATNYNSDENRPELQQDLNDLRLPEDEIYAKSGVSVDSAQVVEIEVSWNETFAHTPRLPHKSRQR